MDRTKLMTVVEARESVRKDFHALLASPTSAWAKWRERIDAKMECIQANAMLVAIEACGAMLNEYQCNCSVDVTAITPDSIRAEQEKPDADQG